MVTDREILANAIDKAINNGWQYKGIFSREQWLERLFAEQFRIPDTIFSHSFAKAFFGTKHIEGKCNLICVDDPYVGAWLECAAWEYHLMMMVRKRNPIKYLEKFL